MEYKVIVEVKLEDALHKLSTCISKDFAFLYLLVAKQKIAHIYCYNCTK